MYERYISCSMKNFVETIRGTRFIIAGAGTQAVRIIRYIRPLRPQYVIDNNSDKWSSVIDGHEIFPPSHYDEEGASLVVIASLNYFAICYGLQGKKEDPVYVLPPIELIYGYS